MSFDQVWLEIAETRIRIRPSDHRMKIGVTPEYFPFLRETPCDAADIDLTVHCQEIPQIPLTLSLFDSGGVWTLGLSGDRFIFHFRTLAADPPLYKLAVMSRDFSKGDVFIRPDTGLVIGNVLYPLEFPLDELLVNHWLANGRGIELHAFGVCFDGRGLVCCGQSGAGKSTMARLWQEVGCGQILSDDRVILRLQDPPKAFGTPWHGDAGVASSTGCPLMALFFLEHTPENRRQRLTPAQASSLLLARSFPPFWDKERMEATLDVITRIVERVPCYRLGFVPDQSIVHFLKSLAYEINRHNRP
ncbi:MAG TPA: hypothetical protein VNM72_13500 [Blastocatellia bacterium]|nr:hypothetical protein [Blastocatellia bacterium]